MIVLHTIKYGDHALIVHGYDADAGRISLMFRGSSRSGRGNPSLLHPLCLLDTVVRKGKGELSLLTEFSETHPLPSIRTRIRKSCIALFLGELLYRTLRESSPDERLYRFLEQGILTLEHLDENCCANYHLWFLVSYAARLGFHPAGFISESGGGNTGFRFSESGSGLLSLLLSAPPEICLAHPLNASRRKSFCDEMIRYLSFHLEVPLEMKSLTVLHEVLSGPEPSDEPIKNEI